MRIDWFIYHVASGHAFFSGLGLIAAGIAFAAMAEGRARRGIPMLVLLGVCFVMISATALPWFVYGLLIAALAVWAATESRRETISRRTRVAGRAMFLGVCVIAAAIELPYHFVPQIAAPPKPVLGVIADSVTAGIGEGEAVTWPKLLAAGHIIVVHDHSQMGATVASARKQAAKLTPEDTIVILEIGGNDLLGATSVAEFETGLEMLLNDIVRPGRSVVMFELPLPPGFNRYGSVQRRLAKRYGVALVPKRVMMGVLSGTGATLDSIHLSQGGHERMAQTVWDVIGEAW